MAKKSNKHILLTIIFSILFFTLIFSYFYYRNWRLNCRAFPKDNYRIYCPPFIYPLGWDKFQQEYQNSLYK